MRLWETQRSGWSIKNIICEYVYLENNDKPTYFSPGEFEKLYSDKTKIVLHYKDGILPLEYATLPSLIQHLQNDYPGCSLRLESIKDDVGGASVTLLVENDSDYQPEEIKQLKTELEERGNEIVHFQKLALEEEKIRLKLEGKVEALQENFNELLKHVGDTYNVGQGFAGRNVTAHDMEFKQLNEKIEE